MSTALFVIDRDVLWLKRSKVGTPPAWIPGHNYKLGDTVVPRPPVAPAVEGMMFQCVGFLGHSGSIQPTFSTVVGDPTIHNNIKWITRDPEVSPVQLDVDEYFLIDQSVTAV